MKINKKNILFSLILIELIFCFLIINTLYQKIEYDKEVNSVKIAKIKKDNLIFTKEEHFKHYFTLKPNSVFKENPGWDYGKITYNYNMDGLNDLSDYPIEKPDDSFRIVTLGDSFTYGHFVNTEYSWPEQLEKMFEKKSISTCGFSKVEVINLGMHAFDVAYITKRYKDIGTKYDPDLILWFESKSGFKRTNEIAFPLQENCQKKYIGPQINPRDTYLPCLAEAYKEIEKQYSEKDIDNYIISHLLDFFSTTNIDKVLFFSFEPLTFNKRDAKSLNNWKESIRGLHFIQIVPDIYKLEQVLPDDYHPNIEGHETIAKSIFTYLTNEQSELCSRLVYPK